MPHHPQRHHGQLYLEALLSFATLASSGAVLASTSGGLVAAVIAQAPDGAPATTATGAEPERGSATVKSDGSALAKAVAAAIKADSTLVAPEAIKVHVSAKGGSVSISGSVATLYDRQQVARDAESAPGVTGIRPSIMVKPTAAVDAEAIKAEVTRAIGAAVVAGPSLSVNVNGEGEVHLAGEVSDEWAAVNAARRVRGVTAIVNYDAHLPGKAANMAEPTLVAKASTANNPEAEKQAQELLANNNIEGLTVRIEGSIAVLSGRASNLGDALLAPELVATVPAILGIRNEITIPSRHVRPSTTPDDARLLADARRALARSRRGTGNVDVHAANGRIYLSGRVSSAEAARAAIEAAASVPGVREVVSVVSYPTLAYGS